MGLRWLFVLCLTVGLLAGSARADTLFSEDFDGYTYFPVQDPYNDWVNPGVPEQSEGADEYWLGGRFDAPQSGTINQDLAVQWIGGGTNNTPVGRFEDEAGLVLQIDASEYYDLQLDFDWRTFDVGTTDRLRAGYYVGDIPGFGNDPNDARFMDFQTGAYTWSAWTEIVNSQSQSFQHVSIALPAFESSIYVAFWMDNGEGDYGKIDNVVITGTLIPEPATGALLGLGVALLVALRRRTTA